MRDRIIALAVIALALVSLPRLRLDYAPDASFPELAVSLRLPPEANADSAETTRRWVIPIESALRAAGDTTGTRGDVDAGAATIVARFKRGTDVELKAARLASDLAPLRARLPAHASLGVFPARGGVRPNAIFALPAGAAAQIADELRSTPGVRDVQTFGTARDEIDVRFNGDASLGAADIVDRLMPHPLGKLRRVPVVAQPAARRIAEIPVGPVRLGDIADIRLRREEPRSLARLDGRDAAIVSVFRDDDTPLLAFDGNVRRVVGARGTAISSDAEELRKILRWLLAGALAAALVMAVDGAVLYVPLALALLVNVWAVASMRADAQTLAVSAIAVAAFASVRRMGIGVLFAALLPIAAIFATGALAPLLTPPARDFAVAAVCALVAAQFARRRPARAPVQPLLRNAASFVLASIAITVFFLSWFGARLDPRRSQGSADRSRMVVRMQLPSGATLAQTARAAKTVEDALRGLHGLRRFWTWATPASATIVIETDPRDELFEAALRARIPASFGNITIERSLDRASAAALAESIEEQPYADENGSIERFLLKGTDAEVLRRTAESLTTRIARGEVPRSAIHSEWPEPSPRIELVPMPGVAPRTADAAAAAMRAATLPPEEVELPGGALLRVALRDGPRDVNDVPRRDDLFARLAVEHSFRVRPSATEGSVMRELGRFVLPMEVAIRAPSREQALAKRMEIDRTVALAPLPAGVVADRPQLAGWSLSMAKLRLASMAAFLPLLLFTAVAIALASLTRALVALAPAALAVAFVAPVLAAASARLEEMTLLAVGAAVCGVAAHTVVVLLQPMHRFVRSQAPAIGLNTIAGGALLLVSAMAHPAIGDAWRAPMLAAATVVIVGTPASLLLPAMIDLLLRDLARRRSPAARAAARPAPWRDGIVLPHLAVRNVTKTYATGFRALHRVSFELGPGVVGLLGPNGAGKTTLLRILSGLLHPTRGTIAWCGVPVRRENLAAFRGAIGFLPQEFNAYAGLTAAQFLDFWALERGIESPRARSEQIEELLAVVGLEEHANRRVRDFSGGMRQRIGIARALLGNPPLLVVDEPTTGLDIEARHRFRDLLTAIARRRIVILSSHIASDVETTAVRLLLLSRGMLRWDGTVDGLLARARGRVFEAVMSDADVRALAHQVRITTRVRAGGGIRVRGVVAEGQPLPGTEAAPTLEEAYLSEVSTGAIRKGSFAFVFARS